MAVTIVGWRKGFCPGCWGCRDGCDGRGGGCTGKEYSYCREIWKECQEAIAHWTVVSRISKTKGLGKLSTCKRVQGNCPEAYVHLGNTNLCKVNVIWGGLLCGCHLHFLWDYLCWRIWKTIGLPGRMVVSSSEFPKLPLGMSLLPLFHWITMISLPTVNWETIICLLWLYSPNT